jgi:hypothetical protein
MSRISLIGVIAIFLTGWWCTTIAADDVCLEPDALLPDVKLTLKHASKNADGLFIGEFELENHTIASGISVSGRRVNGGFHVEYPDARIEFRDFNGVWSLLGDHPPGTYFSSPDTLLVAVHSRVSLKVELLPAERSEMSGGDFRLAIRFSAPSLCIVSDVFRAYPERSPITRIESLPRVHPKRN